MNTNVECNLIWVLVLWQHCTVMTSIHCDSLVFTDCDYAQEYRLAFKCNKQTIVIKDIIIWWIYVALKRTKTCIRNQASKSRNFYLVLYFLFDFFKQTLMWPWKGPWIVQGINLNINMIQIPPPRALISLLWNRTRIRSEDYRNMSYCTQWVAVRIQSWSSSTTPHQWPSEPILRLVSWIDTWTALYLGVTDQIVFPSRMEWSP